LSDTDWEVANLANADTATYDDLGNSIPPCNPSADNGVLSAFLVLKAAPPPGSFMAVTLTTVGGAILQDQAGLSVSAPQTHTATATAPTAPTLVSAEGAVGSTIITLGFSTNVYCTAFSFDGTDIVITDNNPATIDPLVTGAGFNDACGVSLASADASFSISVSMALAASRTYTVILTPEPNEIQDTLGNDLLNPSEISFTTAEGDFTPPTLINTELRSNVTTTDFGDVVDSFEVTFSEVMAATTFGGISLQDTDGTPAFLQCGGQVTCTWNASGTALTVTMTSQLAPAFMGLTPGLQIPATITTLNGFFDLQGNNPNLAGSADRIRDGMDGFILTDDALVQARFHVQEFFGFRFHHLADGNARPLMYYGGDIIHIDDLIELMFGFPFIALGMVFLFESQPF